MNMDFVDETDVEIIFEMHKPFLKPYGFVEINFDILFFSQRV